jgi:hypothetical protein
MWDNELALQAGNKLRASTLVGGERDPDDLVTPVFELASDYRNISRSGTG